MAVSISEIEYYFDRLWPLHRSITGEGNRETFKILSEIFPIDIHEVPSKKELYSGWVVPKEWRINKAYLETLKGNRILDIQDNLLHVLGYSAPFTGVVSKQELEKHLYDDPEKPSVIPYVTSYYEERWGFCISHNERNKLNDEKYRVVIDTELFDGSLSVAEGIIRGNSRREVFFSSFICHPMMANNELAGPLIQAFLARELSKRSNLNFTYRFAWHPETIGAIAYLSLRGETLKQNVVAGYGLCCVGDGSKIIYKRSRRKTSLADDVANYMLSVSDEKTEVRDFTPFDGDERQYCSPGFDLPYGCFLNSPPGEFIEYHTSADNKSIIDFEAMSRLIQLLLACCETIENNRSYKRTDPYCEPRLDKFGLWSTLGVGSSNSYPKLNYALNWLLNYADGRSLIEIAKISGLPFNLIVEAARRCEECGLIVAVNE